MNVTDLLDLGLYDGFRFGSWVIPRPLAPCRDSIHLLPGVLC